MKNKSYKYKNLILRNTYIDKLADIVNEYNNTYHRTIKMNPVHVKPGIYINFGIENKEKDPKFKVGDHVTISKYKNNFPNCYEEGLCD